jgi:pimeloyl-ACP methyl ester carboxylesterase
MSGEPDTAAPLGRIPAAAAQIASAVDHISQERGVDGLSIVAHSWGTLAAARYASSHPQSVERLVLFGPIARREIAPDVPALAAFRDVTIDEQYSRFIEDVPDGQGPVLEDFDKWARDYLASDSEAETRDPPAVRIPGGPPGRHRSVVGGLFPLRPREPRSAGADRARSLG